MCGIAGIINLKQQLTNSVIHLKKMADNMHHRGPDGEGYLIAQHDKNSIKTFKTINDPSSLSGSVFLAHRRLAIVDLSLSANQPMSCSNGQYWVVYNGEIYNYKLLRDYLKTRGYQFNTQSDTEVLLIAYQEWGSDMLSKLDGMFAFCIWDNVKKVIFCARDRIGEKPFYYTINNNQFIFASDIQTLIASELYQPQINLEGLYYSMSFGVAPRPMTVFKNVWALSPAHFLRINPQGEIHIDRFWEIPINQQNNGITEIQAIEELDYLLKKSVGTRLNADVEVGTFMSGGIDSTTISSIASRIKPGIKALTLAFSGDKKLDEFKQAQSSAIMNNIQHIVQDVRADGIVEKIEQMVKCYEEPFYDISPNFLISQLVSENKLKVILNGNGGDELFAGYPYYNWLNRWLFLKRLKPLLKFSSHFSGIGHLAQRLHAIADTSSADRFALSIRNFITEQEKKLLFIDSTSQFDTIEKIHELYVGPHKKFSSPLEAMSYIDIINYIGNHHVYRIDKFTMNFSIEARLPFLDHSLVEFAIRLPDKLKLKNGCSKYVLREVAKQYIPNACLKAKKKGFDLPTSRWMKTILNNMVQDSLINLSKRNIFNEKIIRRIYNEWKYGFRSFRAVWQLVSVELWLQAFNIRT